MTRKLCNLNEGNLTTLPCHNINSTLNVVVQGAYNAVTNRDQASKKKLSPSDSQKHNKKRKHVST